MQGAPGQPREAQLEIGPLEVQLRRHEDIGAQEVPFSYSLFMVIGQLEK